MSNPDNWVRDLIGTDTKAAAAEKSGVSISTMNFQIRNNSLSPATVISLARAYGRNVIQALAETDLIDPDEASSLPVDQALQLAPDRKLIAELARRLQHLPQEDLESSLDDIVERHGAEDELAARREAGDEDDGTVVDWDPTWDNSAAADSSPDEDAGREESGSDPFD